MVELWLGWGFDNDDEMIARFSVEHFFIAVPINVNREEESDKKYMLICTTMTESRKEEEGGKKSEEEKEKQTLNTKLAFLRIPAL